MPGDTPDINGLLRNFLNGIGKEALDAVDLPGFVESLPPEIKQALLSDRNINPYAPVTSQFGETAVSVFVALAGSGSNFSAPYHEDALRDIYGAHPGAAEDILALVRLAKTLPSPVTEEALRAQISTLPEADQPRLSAAADILHDAAEKDIGTQAEHPFAAALDVAGNFFSPQLPSEMWKLLDEEVEINDPFAQQYDGSSIMIDRAQDAEILKDKMLSDPESIIQPVEGADIDQAYKVLENGGTILLQALDVRPYADPAVQAGVGMPEAIATLTGKPQDVIATPEEYAARLASGDFAGKTLHYMVVQNEPTQSIAAGFEEIVLSNKVIANAMLAGEWPAAFPQVIDGIETNGPAASHTIANQIVELLAARDAEGNIIMGEDGKPVLRENAAELAEHIELGGYSMGGLRATLALDMAYPMFSDMPPEGYAAPDKQEVFSHFTVFAFGGAMLVNPEAPYKVINTLNHDGAQHHDLVIDRICAIQRELLPQGDNYLELHAPFKDPDLEGHSIVGLYAAIHEQLESRQFMQQVASFMGDGIRQGDPVSPPDKEQLVFAPEIQNVLGAVGNIFSQFNVALSGPVQEVSAPNTHVSDVVKGPDGPGLS